MSHSTKKSVILETFFPANLLASTGKHMMGNAKQYGKTYIINAIHDK